MKKKSPNLLRSSEELRKWVLLGLGGGGGGGSFLDAAITGKLVGPDALQQTKYNITILYLI